MCDNARRAAGWIAIIGHSCPGLIHAISFPAAPASDNDSGMAEGVDIFLMKTSDLPRHQIIENLTAQHTEPVADAAISLWEQMATALISIVGEGGFDSLYARSVFLARSAYPWLAASPLSPQTDHRFAQLKKSLEGQTPAQASAANRLLLITFTDILAALIGEQITTSLLRSAWGNDASTGAGKEFHNE